MAEIGNILFDRCDGGFKIQRGAGYEEELKRLFDAADPDRDTSWRDYGPSFENETFQIWPYSWCDCDCGYDEKEEAWSKANRHQSDCYQTRRDRAIKEWELMNDYDAIQEASYCDVVEEKEESSEFFPGLVCHTILRRRSEMAEKAHQQWCKLHTKRTTFEEQISKSLCRELGIPWNKGRGSAVHCTCDYRERWAKFSQNTIHDLRCQIARKSFLYKPESFWIDWYKYPLRDAHSSRKVSLNEFREIIDKCLVSLVTDKGGPVVTLESLRDHQKGTGNDQDSQ